MGALHDGHLSLVRQSIEQSDVTVVTIFVNPTQFAPGEDWKNYPRLLDEDLAKLADLGVETVFAPPADEMYPAGFSTLVQPPDVSLLLEGEFRQTHFRGVATVVLKLLNLAQADKAFFGQKDFQQVQVVRRMVADLNVQTEIVICPIVRESDGLALSSRNRYLSDDERARAVTLNRTIAQVREQIEAGDRDAHALMSEMRQSLIDGFGGTGGVESIDYAVLANPETLQIYDEVELPVVALVAASVGKTRLIDNCLITDH